MIPMERARPVQEKRGEAKKRYSRPTLVVYGSITKLTQGSSGSGVDAGVGKRALPCL
jgi:hypothetical protein